MNIKSLKFIRRSVSTNLESFIILSRPNINPMVLKRYHVEVLLFQLGEQTITTVYYFE